jgi:hypothetical protein
MKHHSLRAIWLIAALALAGCAANTTNRSAVATAKAPHDHWKASDADGCRGGGCMAMRDHWGGPRAFMARHWWMRHHQWMRHHRWMHRRQWMRQHDWNRDQGPMRRGDRFDRDEDSRGGGWGDSDGHHDRGENFRGRDWDDSDGRPGGWQHGPGGMPDHGHFPHPHSAPATQPSAGGK